MDPKGERSKWELVECKLSEVIPAAGGYKAGRRKGNEERGRCG